MRQLRPSKRDAQVVYDATDVAQILGLHRRTVCRWIARGKIKAHRLGDVGSRLRVRHQDFVAFLNNHGVMLGRGIGRMLGQAMGALGERQTPSAWRRR